MEQAGRRHGHPEQRAPRAGRLAPLEEEPLAGPVPLLDLADGRPPQQAVDRRRQADALSPEAAAALGYDFQPQWIAKTSRGASLQFNNRTDANVVMKKVDGNNELHEVDGQNPEPMEIGIAKETLVKVVFFQHFLNNSI